jgi:threonine/homoserine/homoserine lactone efflux protein
MQIDAWLTFCSVALLATLCPGPATLLVTAHSLQFGTVRSLYTIAGNLTGLFVISAGVVLALSGITLYSSTGFMLIKIAGALYLFYLGCRLCHCGIRMASQHVDEKKAKPGHLYFQGLTMSLLNPMAITFIATLSSQFIVLNQPLLPQFSIQVITFMSFSLFCSVSYALLAKVVHAGSKHAASEKVTGRLFGSAFILASTALVHSML